MYIPDQLKDEKSRKSTGREQGSTAEDSLEAVVDVAIVNWNTAANAIDAARAYSVSTDVETRVRVVDNDSEPDQQEQLHAASGDGFELIEAGSNLGFGVAANLVLESGSGNYVLVSNADVKPEPDAVAEMVRAAREHPDAGMVGPVFIEGANNYHDNLPGPFTLLMRTMVGSFGRDEIELPSSGQVARIEQPSGACFLVERGLWQRVGGFDSGYFLWYEDVDLARRLHDKGKIGYVVGGARVDHIGGESFSMVTDRSKQEIRIESLKRYLSVHHPRTALVARPLLWISSKLRGRKSEVRT